MAKTCDISAIEFALNDKDVSAYQKSILARVMFVHSPALFWARVGDGEDHVRGIM